ncbi:gnat family [Fusarium albosuccineum]|uniref:Gnat family n=1 Tax=Fusarium albosuccineum TaxID=1237068 RepID=A0A8H4KZJ6_9HYPO|nr:gnat family [Fusarium albosuccineum]
MCHVYFSAFGDTVIGSRVFLENKDAASRMIISDFSQEMLDPLFQFLVVTHKTTPDSADEEVIAFAKWCLPGAPINDPPPAEVWPANGELAVEFFTALTRGHRKHMGEKPHYYLGIIGTKKEFMRQGAASLLIRWGLDKADAAGQPCFLEATVKGKGLYEKFGYRTVGEDVFDWPERRTVEAYMVRDAKTDGVPNGH